MQEAFAVTAGRWCRVGLGDTGLPFGGPDLWMLVPLQGAGCKVTRTGFQLRPLEDRQAAMDCDHRKRTGARRRPSSRASRARTCSGVGIHTTTGTRFAVHR